jgi:hypothetical protein
VCQKEPKPALIGHRSTEVRFWEVAEMEASQISELCEIHLSVLSFRRFASAAAASDGTRGTRRKGA